MGRAGLALTILALAQMTGDLLNFPALKGVAAATTASPAPKVFSAVRGLETYSTRFVIEYTDPSGERREVALTQQMYAKLRGPYNRRNIYGAALAYGPVLATEPLTQPMFDHVSRYALCGERPILRELGIEAVPDAPVRIRYEPVGGTDLAGLPRVLEPSCK
jgi:hypothetical protein